MRKILIIIFLLTLTMESCQKKSQIQKDKTVNKDIIKMNDYAIELSSIHGDSKDSVIKALKIINEVIAIDSTFMLGYNNKLAILLKLGHREESLDLIDKIISKNKESANFYLIKGHLLEKSGRKKEALKEYLTALKLRQDILKHNPNDIKAKINLLQVYLVTDSLSNVKSKFEVLKKEYPTDKNIIMMEELINHFDRNKFLELY